MSLATSNLPPIGILLANALVIFVVISLSVISLWWIRNVLRHRLPKPFLGEGTNIEWAKLKRAELMATTIEPEDLSTSSKVISSSTSLSSTPQADIDVVKSGRNGGDSEDLSPERTINQESLLQAWLEESEHIDDGWAEKLLGKEGSAEET